MIFTHLKPVKIDEEILLPRKSDIERKIAIIEFATKSRQQFVRLLALVKWAASAENVVKCQVISSILDHQSFLFIDTADNLSRTARETLINARLPAFSLPAAVDVLTTETYSRLPACIRDRIIPADPITGNERIKTLKRLDQVIQQRLITSKLPPQMSNLVIAEGRVKFTVEDEFEVSLTLMGDDPSVPWRLLSVDFLVQDFKTGEGKSLVHGLQVQYIHQLAQSRLFTEESPLVDLYTCLHSFCSLLQLEVLHSQSQRLVRERWSENVKIENYVVGQKLTISFWRNPKHRKWEKENYNVSIVVGNQDQKSSLTLQHTPTLKSKGKTKNVIVSTKRLCIETILNGTIQAQSLAKLEVVKDLLLNDKSTESLALLDSKIPELTIKTHVTSSVISVLVDSRTGLYDIAISNSEALKLCLTLKNSLNKDLNNFANVLNDVRCALRVQQCVKNVQNMATSSTSLPLVNFSDHALSQLSKHKLYMKFQMHTSYYLVFEVKIDSESSEFCEDYYLLKVKPANPTHPSAKESSESSRRTSSSEKGEKQVEGFFLKAGPLVKLDADFISDLTNNSNDGTFVRSCDVVLDHSDGTGENVKRMKIDSEVATSRYVPKVGEVYSICNARIPYLILCNEFNKAKIPYHMVYKDKVDLSVRILDLPTVANCDKKVVQQLKKNLLYCTLSHDTNNGSQWIFKIVMANPPFKWNQPNATQHVLLSYKSGGKSREEKREDYSDKYVWSKFLDDWKSICRLYTHAKELDEYLEDSRSNLSNICSIHDYSYKELVIAYGPDFQNLVTVSWSVVEKAFTFSFSHIGGETCGHHHEMIKKILQNEFSKHYNLPYVIQILHETCSPFYSLSKLPTTLRLFRGSNISPAFTVIPQSSNCVRLSFKDYFMIEFNFRAKQLVSVRDCAHYKIFLDKFQAQIQQIYNLKVFLQQYNDTHTDIAAKNVYALNWESSLTTPSSTSLDLRPRFENPQRSPYSTAYNDLRSVPPVSSKQGLVPRLMPLSSLNFPVPSPAIPMSPTVTNFLTAPASAPSTSSTYMSAPSHASNFIASPATPYQFPITSPATPQTGVPSPAVVAPSPGSTSWSAQTPSSNIHQRIPANQRTMPGQPQTQSSTQQQSGRRMLNWVSVRPSLISHACFDKIMTPAVLNTIGGHKVLVTPLEQFLSCHFLLIYFKKVITPKFGKTLMHLPQRQNGFAFKTSNFKLSVFLEATTFRSLHLEVQPLPGQENFWKKEDLQDLQKFFELKVVSYPYKLNNLVSFLKMISAEQTILRDIIQIIKLELHNDPSHLWNLEWCLTVPPGDQRRKQFFGSPAVVIADNNKVVFFIQLTRSRSNKSIGNEDNAIIVPIYLPPQNGTTSSHVTSLDTVPSDSSIKLSPHLEAVIAHLKTWNETASHPGQCPLYPAILSLLKNLVVPE
ncbi:mediator of RNA polymerase II transcription subunit 14-like isoform X2 [Dendronephthya gigantea]|uniref:mediator of RNA polymerase II transcription subunit 14-like isoform X2 n=1 Tax=Dendronephthya gigantea TaxID=151771 RepID=UPI0010692A6F|nr:mediator of RNA polymerase II transcription subunit 14-like isoform X2 [Dendronephthya gigantea]